MSGPAIAAEVLQAPVLRGWALDDRSYAVQLGAALMGVTLRTEADRQAEQDGPVLEAGNRRLAGARTILQALGGHEEVDPAWRARAADGWEDRAEELGERFSLLRRATLAGAKPDDTAPAAAHALLRPLEDRLAELWWQGLPFLGGRRPAIADLLAFPAAALSHDLRLPHDLYPSLRRFIRAMRRQPGFVTMPGIPHYP